MNDIKQSCIEEISLLLNKPNKALAKKIYNNYEQKLSVRVAILDMLAQELKHDIPGSTFDTLYRNILIHDGDKLTDSNICSTEAISYWCKNHTLDTKYSTEALLDDISNQHISEYNLHSPNHIEYYINSKKEITSIPDNAICMIALESMIDGRSQGITGSEYFTHKTVNYSISAEVMNKFNTIFSKEDEYFEKSKAGYVLAATERFFANDYNVQEKLKSAPQCDPAKFKSLIHEGDVLIVYRKPKYIGLSGMILNKINSKVTGSSFMSIKLIGKEGKTAIGFGALIGPSLDNMNCREVPIDYMIETCAGMVAIRHEGITPAHAAKITKYAQKVVADNIRYDVMSIIKTMFVHRKEERLGAAKILSRDEAKHYYTPMICTTLITAAYRGVDLDPGVHYSDKLAWPIDVLKSDKFYTVATYFDKAEGVNLKKEIYS